MEPVGADPPLPMVAVPFISMNRDSQERSNPTFHADSIAGEFVSQYPLAIRAGETSYVLITRAGGEG
jgi:hypothetical protein